MEDAKDRLKSKLYEQKLEQLLIESENRHLYRCVYCNRLFTLEQREWMSCDKAKIFIDFHGNVISKHVADRDFDMHSFIMSLRAAKWSWQKIFLNIYSLFQEYDCLICGQKFVASEIKACAWHP